MEKMRSKIGMYVYLDPDTYRIIEDMRNPAVPKSTFCSMILEEAIGIRR
jgi:hypothetical protein